MRVGISFSDALQNLDRRVGSEDLELVCSAMEIARRTGGNLTEIFDKISLTIRERMRIERRVQTLTAQGRLQGIIVACMPALLGTAMTFIKPGLMIPFFKSVNGMAAIGLTVLFVLLFWLAGPSLKPLGKLNLIVFFVGVVALNVFSGVPIAPYRNPSESFPANTICTVEKNHALNSGCWFDRLCRMPSPMLTLLRFSSSTPMAMPFTYSTMSGRRSWPPFSVTSSAMAKSFFSGSFQSMR